MNDTASGVARIDRLIARHRDLELRAYWAGRDAEAQWHVDEIARLQHVRDELERGASAPSR